MRDVEGIGEGLEALRRARKPVLICAPEGRSEAARRSIVAHTGALAGNTALRDAWLRGHGVVLVEDPVTMFEAALLLSHVKRLRTPGVAAALQSGGACTLFAEAAGSQRLALPEFASDHQAEAQAGPAALRLAEQPARRDRTGGRRDRHVRGRDRGARERPRRRPDRVRRVPPAAGGRDALGRPGVAQGAPAPEDHRRRVRERGDEPARLHPRGDRVHAGVAAPLPAGAPGRVRRDRRVDPVPVLERARGARPAPASGARASAARAAGTHRARRRGHGGEAPRALRRAPSEGRGGGHAVARGCHRAARCGSRWW